MTSSDSEEDFESADEDFEFENTSNNTNVSVIKQFKSSVEGVSKNNEKSNFLVGQNSEPTSNVIHLQDLKLEDGSIKRISIKPFEEKDKRCEVYNDTELQVQCSENIVSSFPEKEIEEMPEKDIAKITEKNIEKITEKAIEKIIEKDIEKITEKNIEKITEKDIENQTFECFEDEKIDEISLQPLKPKNSLYDKAEDCKTEKTEVELDIKRKESQSLGDGWDIEEVEEDLLAQPTIETVGTKSKSETTSIRPSEEITSTFKNKEDGWDNDGWEIEEEDGFEIPVSLAKISDSSIQPAEKHICEMGAKKSEQEQSWRSWGGWGVTSLLSSATGSVTAGLSTVLESAVGAPDPETLAATTCSSKSSEGHETTSPINVEDHVRESEVVEVVEKSPSSFSGFGSIVSLGSSVINRGLDTLETLGKKTMEVLQEGDPGLKKKRAMLFSEQDKPILSQILREAKEKADNCDKEKEEKEIARKVHFESLFDDFQGMVHLEALEMLSTQCDLKLQSLLLSESGAQLEDLQETLAQVKDLCELTGDDDDDSEVLSPQQFAEQVTKCLNGLNINISAAKIIKVNDEVVSKLVELSGASASVVSESAISSLAKFTAAAMESFHKSAELLLAKQLRNTPNEADHYTELTNHLCARVSAIANEFTQLLTKNHPIANSSSITNIFLEASNCCSYMKNACQLLVPIPQVGAVRL